RPDGRFRRWIKAAGDIGTVTITREVRLQLFYVFAAIAHPEARPIHDMGRLNTVANPMGVEFRPVEFLTRIGLSCRRNIGMGEHALGLNAMAFDNVATESNHCLHLSFRKVGI